MSPDLTLLVGENNSGKTNIIEALRLATSQTDQRRSRYFEETDFCGGDMGTDIEIEMRFDDLTPTQEGLYATALDLDSEEVVYTTRYHYEADTKTVNRPQQLAGMPAGPDAEPDQREHIAHVYLRPLRDAQRELDSGTGNRLVQVIRQLTAPEDETQFRDDANASLQAIAEHPVVGNVAIKIKEQLGQLTEGVRPQDAAIGHEAQQLNRLVRSLRLKMGERNVSMRDIAESGLGFANLLYMATVILELQEAAKHELTLFLVEEPEAHLHPQLQAALLDHLKEVAAASSADDANGPEGRIQVIATSHSPNLASGVSTSNLVVVKSQEQPAEPGAAGEEGPVQNPTVSVAVPLGPIDLTDQERRKVDRYVDATKSAIFFARKVVLVEGISEAVLLPIVAKCVEFMGDDKAVERKRVAAATIVPIGSVDFEPYIRLLLTKVNGQSATDRVVVITDSDPSQEDQTAARIAKLAELETVFGESLKVYKATNTLEADWVSAGNCDLIRELFLEVHPQSAAKCDELVTGATPEERGAALYQALRSKKLDLPKGEFAQLLAQRIEGGSVVTCPQYLKDAFIEIVSE